MEETLEFTAETGKLLNIVANALYSQKEIFLRELVSNASDACDRLRFEAIAKPELLKNHPGFSITILPDKPNNTLTIVDTGIGMNRKELIDNLGTIARSGTGKFLEKLAKTDKAEQFALIGQFGVGFYSALMVADTIDVKTCKAGSKKIIRWTTDGKGKYTIADEDSKQEFGAGLELPDKITSGTIVTLTMKKDAEEYLESSRLNHIIRTYANHINVPVILQKDSGGTEQANDSQALWLKPKNDIKPEDYEDFYHSETLLFDKPWLHLHYHAEGMLDYYALLFVPTDRPFDLFYPEKASRIKLYVKRVFITDNCESLIPAWLRFVTGIIDSSDIDLNISREMIQSSPVLMKIKNNLIKRITAALKAKRNEDADGYSHFFEQFGAVLKEGLCDPMESQKPEILPLVLGYSLQQQKLISLDDYIDKADKSQDKIYYLTGENLSLMQQSPHLEGAKQGNYDVLLLTDPVDEFWPGLIGSYKDKKFQSVQSDEAADSKAEDDSPKTDAAMQALIDAFQSEFKDKLQSVRLSGKLQQSPVRLMSGEGSSPRLERLMRVHRADTNMPPQRHLELNGAHPLIKGLANQMKAVKDKDNLPEDIRDVLSLLYEQARMIDGDAPEDVAGFSLRLTRLLEKSCLSQ